MTRFSAIRDSLMRVPLTASQVPASQCNESSTRAGRGEPVDHWRPIQRPIKMMTTDIITTVRSLVNHQGMREGCSSTARTLHTPIWVRKALSRYELFHRRAIVRVRPSYPRPAAHTAPPAMNVMPTMKSIVSARVSIQLLRMVRLNRWTAQNRVALKRY